MLNATEDSVCSARAQALVRNGTCRSDYGIRYSLSVPREHSIFIQRVAPLSPEQVKQKEMELEQRKTTWGYRKRLARASKVKRKEFW